MTLAGPSDDAKVGDDTLTDMNGSALVEVPTHDEAQQQVVTMRRRLIDLPDIPERMNTLGVVLSYELFGLSPVDIAEATGLSFGQVSAIMLLDAYGELRVAVIEGIAERDAQGIRDVFLQKAGRSAVRITELAESDRADIALMAAKEVLDRSGHTVKQVVEHQHTIDGALRIEFIKRDTSEKVPTIDVAPPPNEDKADADSVGQAGGTDVTVRGQP